MTVCSCGSGCGSERPLRLTQTSDVPCCLPQPPPVDALEQLAPRELLDAAEAAEEQPEALGEDRRVDVRVGIDLSEHGGGQLIRLVCNQVQSSAISV